MCIHGWWEWQTLWKRSRALHHRHPGRLSFLQRPAGLLSSIPSGLDVYRLSIPGCHLWKWWWWMWYVLNLIKAKLCLKHEEILVSLHMQSKSEGFHSNSRILEYDWSQRCQENHRSPNDHPHRPPYSSMCTSFN